MTITDNLKFNSTKKESMKTIKTFTQIGTQVWIEPGNTDHPNYMDNEVFAQD
jgi:hypothetical protein